MRPRASVPTRRAPKLDCDPIAAGQSRLLQHPRSADARHVRQLEIVGRLGEIDAAGGAEAQIGQRRRKRCEEPRAADRFGGKQFQRAKAEFAATPWLRRRSRQPGRNGTGDCAAAFASAGGAPGLTRNFAPAATASSIWSTETIVPAPTTASGHAFGDRRGWRPRRKACATSPRWRRGRRRPAPSPAQAHPRRSRPSTPVSPAQAT